jgi:hypothetical protein
MTPSVTAAVEGIRRAFPGASVLAVEDASGGAYVIIEPVTLTEGFVPAVTWIGGHLPAQVPYTDVYPLFIDGGIRRRDGQPFQPPITPGQAFCGRPSLQVSRRSNRLDPEVQTPATKFQKVLLWLRQQA